jgi:crotonobetainyl-CoA:carnitine CoA-transferase CaiB-like acyl-CoA transferase
MCLQGAQIAEYFVTGKEPVPCGNDSPFAYPVGVFKTLDGYIAVSAYNEKFWRHLCTALDLRDLIGNSLFDSVERRLANREALRPILAARFSGRRTAQLLDVLERGDVPCAPVHTYGPLFQDPQVRENALVKEWPHARLKSVKAAGNPLRFSRSPVTQGAGPPLLGQHTEQVLSGLGFSREEIEAFRAKGIV